MKRQKEKPNTKAIIDKWLARILTLTKAETSVSFRIDVIHFDAKKGELAATDKRTLFIAKVKPSGVLIPLNLETGIYDIVSNMLIKRETIEEEIAFPPYQSIIPVKAKEICFNNILDGIVECMIKGQIYLNIWKYATVLKILNGFSKNWIFANDSPTQPVMMEAEDDKYNIKYIIMPIV